MNEYDYRTESPNPVMYTDLRMNMPRNQSPWEQAVQREPLTKQRYAQWLSQDRSVGMLGAILWLESSDDLSLIGEFDELLDVEYCPSEFITMDRGTRHSFPLDGELPVKVYSSDCRLEVRDRRFDRVTLLWSVDAESGFILDWLSEHCDHPIPIIGDGRMFPSEDDEARFQQAFG